MYCLNENCGFEAYLPDDSEAFVKVIVGHVKMVKSETN